MDDPTLQIRPEPGSLPTSEPRKQESALREVASTSSPVNSTLPHVMENDLCDEQGPIPPYPSRRYNEQGRPIPFTAEEITLRNEIFRRRMAVINANDQDPPGSDEEFMRGIDSHRPAGMKLFEEYY
jgi:hypothetical protein